MSEVAISNAALLKLGAETITSMTDSNNRARAVNARYAQVRDAELRRHRWYFAIERVSIAALAAVPDSDYDRQFELPNDFIRIIPGGDLVDRVCLSDYRGGGNALYKIEGRKLLTNLSAPLAIRYIKQVTDTSLFDPAFVEMLASRLAYEICGKVTGNDADKDRLLIDYKMARREAVLANALELATEEVLDDTWVMARAR